MLKMCFYIPYAPECFRMSNVLSRWDAQRAKYKQVRRFTAEKKNVYAVHSLIWRHSVQKQIFNLKIAWSLPFYLLWKTNNGECCCVHSDILKHSVAMSDPCENCKPTPGLKLMVWESRAGAWWSVFGRAYRGSTVGLLLLQRFRVVLLLRTRLVSSRW